MAKNHEDGDHDKAKRHKDGYNDKANGSKKTAIMTTLMFAKTAIMISKRAT